MHSMGYDSKKEWTIDTHKNISEPQNNCWWRKQDIKNPYYISVYKILENVNQLIMTADQWLPGESVVGGGGAGGRH